MGNPLVWFLALPCEVLQISYNSMFIQNMLVSLGMRMRIQILVEKSGDDYLLLENCCELGVGGASVKHPRLRKLTHRHQPELSVLVTLTGQLHLTAHFLLPDHYQSSYPAVEEPQTNSSTCLGTHKLLEPQQAINFYFLSQ